MLIKIIAHIKRKTKLCLEEQGLTSVISLPVWDNEVIDTLSAKSILDDADVLIKEIYLHIADFYNGDYWFKVQVTVCDLPKGSKIDIRDIDSVLETWASNTTLIEIMQSLY